MQQADGTIDDLAADFFDLWPELSQLISGGLILYFRQILFVLGFFDDRHYSWFKSSHEILVSFLDVLIVLPKLLILLVDTNLSSFLFFLCQPCELIIKKEAQLDLAVIERLEVGTDQVEQKEQAVLLGDALLTRGEGLWENLTSSHQVVC